VGVGVEKGDEIAGCNSVGDKVTGEIGCICDEDEDGMTDCDEVGVESDDDSCGDVATNEDDDGMTDCDEVGVESDDDLCDDVSTDEDIREDDDEELGCVVIIGTYFIAQLAGVEALGRTIPCLVK
jgi:hypothetical protein